MKMVSISMAMSVVVLCQGCAFISITTDERLATVIIPKSSSGTSVIPREELGDIRNMVAVVVGVSKYKHEGEGWPKLQNLRYASADADAMAAHLVSSSFNTVELLTNEKASLSSVRTAITSRVGAAGNNDFVLVFWAGHGIADQNDPQKLYLMTYDADPDDLASTAYAMADFRKDVTRTDSKRLMVIIDTCHAGGVSDPTLGFRSAGNDVQTALRGVYVAEGSAAAPNSASPASAMRLVLTSCEAGEVSRESSDYGHGVFTYYLLRGMQGDADTNHDGVVTLDETIEYTRSKVRSFSNAQQNPSAAGFFDRSIPMGITKNR